MKIIKERNELPWIFDLYKTISTVSGKFSASLITGPQLEQDEVELAPWLKCNLFSDGIDYDKQELNLQCLLGRSPK